MSASVKILAYLLGTLLLGCLSSPPLYWAGQTLGAQSGRLRWLADTDFQRYFDRAMFIAAIALLFPAARALQIGWREMGLDPRGWTRMFAGFGMAAGVLWLFGCMLWRLGVYYHKGFPSTATVLGFLATAVVVGVLEEAFFRGALLGLVRRTASDKAALWFVSLLFATLHFLKPPDDAAPDGPITWLSGFGALARAGWQFREPQLLAGGFATLLLVGLLLGYARLRTQSLWLPMGMHAGWIFALKTFSRSSKHVADPTLVFGKDMITGLGPVCLLLVTGGCLWIYLRREVRREHAAAVS